MGFQPTRFDPPARLGLHSSGDPNGLPSSPTIELEIIRGAARHTRRPVVGKVFLIGSACDCDLVLGDEQFPDAYAYLFVQDGEVTVRHLGGGPAVLIDGEQVQARRLADGDVLECGPFAFRLVVRQREPKGRNDRATSGPHFDLAAQQKCSLVPAEDVLGLRVAREEVARLLADIAAVALPKNEELKLYPGSQNITEPSLPSLMQRVRRRAS